MNIDTLKEVLGLANGLTAEHKNDLILAGVKSAPAVGASAGAVATQQTEATLLGLTGNAWVIVATLILIALQVAHLAWKWRRDYRMDQEHQTDRARIVRMAGGREGDEQ
ncbi:MULTISPECIES: hypothetical protein [Delftia]|jgi:beta-lactamase regulating signal transducer with metallopeptidase domain|uniref:hypothetical protein n=1 Tax=Delftia TaxID=80865 RepID=UPI000501E897|nr:MULTISPECIES: hypothetical protein [Delftia]KFJ11414.1 hypothetical protein DR66_2773 [Delftia acidovorans]MBS3723044.1 hypothetical protein [Delftia sp. PE138]MXN30011.1 hypothetical protein [Delftia sp. CH05]QQB52960.1 hypothetical protein I6H54_12125 [Delftia acidovorans]